MNPRGDYTALLQNYKSIQNKDQKYVRLVVSTKGGSVTEAIKIGRWLRINDVELFVPPGHECTSACVYILAGAKKRYVIGKIGIHRPYLSDEPDQDVETFMRNLLISSRKYFEDMNVAPSLVEDMFSISPENVKYLSEDEAKKYRLSDDDFSAKEASDLKIAKRLGISRTEWMRRSATAKEKCDIYRFSRDNKYADCYVNELNKLNTQ